MIKVPKGVNSIKGEYKGELASLIRRQEVYRFEDGARILDKQFYCEDKNNFYFLNKLKSLLTSTKYEEILPNEKRVSAKFKSNSPFSLRDYQEVIKKFVKKRLKRLYTRVLVALDTGKGKTLVGCNIFVTHNIRFSILILPKYIEKWISDIKKNIKLTDDDYYLVQGSESLIKLMMMKKKDIPRIIIYSNRTLLNAIKHMNVFGEIYSDRYPMALTDLMGHTGSTQLLIDESHQEFNSLYLCVIMLNPRMVLGLSATFDTDEQDSKQHFLDMFPAVDRVNPLDIDKYRSCIAMEYHVGRGDKVWCTNYYTKNYCHLTYEKNITRSPKLLEAYLTMIEDIVLVRYIGNKESRKGKMLIFASSKIMIELIIGKLKKAYPAVDIRRYMGEDPLANVLDAEICVTTIGSAGTAIDIENLREVLMTVSVSSTNANIQAFGRLRQIPDFTPNFTYIWSKDIGTQINHHKVKMGLYGKRTTSFKVEEYGVDLLPKFW